MKTHLFSFLLYLDISVNELDQSINHLYFHKPYTTVQGRHPYTIIQNGYKHIYSIYNKDMGVRQPREQKIYLYFV
jgi:hypothetical protein